MSTEASSSSTSSIPPEVVQKLGDFNKAISDVEETLEKHFAIKFEQHLERSPVEMARIDVMSLFTLSSLGWCIASMKGEDPNESGDIRTELNRTKEYHGKLKTLENRKAAPRVNSTAAKNFVRNALWEVPPTEQSEVDPDSPVPKKKKQSSK